MKKLYIAVALLLGLSVLVSCEKTNNQINLEGLWVATDYIYYFNESISPKDSESEDLFNGYNDISFRFFSDGTGIWNYTFVYNFVYTISGNTVRIHFPGEDEKYDLILLIDGKKLILEQWVSSDTKWDEKQLIHLERRCLDFIFEKQSK